MQHEKGKGKFREITQYFPRLVHDFFSKPDPEQNPKISVHTAEPAKSHVGQMITFGEREQFSKDHDGDLGRQGQREGQGPIALSRFFSGFPQGKKESQQKQS